jgi:hypothetical protein
VGCSAYGTGFPPPLLSNPQMQPTRATGLRCYQQPDEATMLHLAPRSVGVAKVLL